MLVLCNGEGVCCIAEEREAQQPTGSFYGPDPFDVRRQGATSFDRPRPNAFGFPGLPARNINEVRPILTALLSLGTCLRYRLRSSGKIGADPPWAVHKLMVEAQLYNACSISHC